MALVGVNGIELDVERRGEGPPLLAIMGMSGTALHWGEPFLSALGEHFDVIAYDHRGVGASSRLAQGSVTIPQMARDAAGLLGALNLDSAHVLGISMGGMVAQELALAEPALVRTLTLGCTYCGGPGSALSDPEVLESMREPMLAGDREGAIRAAWEANVSPAFADEEPAWQEFRAIAERRSVAVPVITAQLMAIARHDTSARLPGLQVPTLVVHGTEDRMLPVGNGRLIASLIPGAHLEILEGVGHLFFWELPGRSAQLVREHASALAA